ncbi:MAG: fibronectin type III domain-containing protein [Bacteroidia bacterium]|nr:fibronectin type III domain-containing protein [Bacteroidia bacterium]
MTGCLSSRVAVVARIKPVPPLPSVNNQVFLCGPGVMFFTVNAPAADEVAIYENPTSTLALFVDNTPQPFILSTGMIYTTTTFYIASYNSSTRCQSQRREVVATIQPLPAAPSAQGVNRCGPGTLVITVTFSSPSPSTWVNLYTTPTATSPTGNMGIPPSYQITIPDVELEGTITYYLESINNVTGCRSQRVPVLATVNPIPGAVQVEEVARCGRGTVTFTVRMGQPAGTEVRLYDSSLPTAAAIASDNNPPFELMTPILETSRTFWVRSINLATGCTSSAVSVDATINPVIQPPIFSNGVRCGAGEVKVEFKLNNNFPGNQVRIYTSEVGGANIRVKSPAMQEDFIALPSVVSSTTYYAEARDSITGCFSTRSAFIVNILPLPGPPVVSDYRRCGPGAITISAAMGNPAGDQLIVYHPDNSQQVIATSSFPFEVVVPEQVFDPNKSTFQIPVRIKSSTTGCESPITMISVVQHMLPAKPQAADVFRCGIGGVEITVQLGNPAGNVVNLYSLDNPEVPIFSRNTAPFVFNIPNVTTTTTWVVESMNSATGCRSLRDTVQIEIKPLPEINQVSAAPRCGPGFFSIQVNSQGEGWVEFFEIVEGGSSMAQVYGSGPHFEFQTPSYSSSTTLFVQKRGLNGCTSVRVPIQLMVVEPPKRPLVADVFICGNNMAVFSVEPLDNEIAAVRLYTQVSGGEPVAIATNSPYTLSVNIHQNSTFYVESVRTLYNCPGPRALAKAFLIERPGIPSAQNVSRCGPGVASISAIMGSPLGNQIRLYSQPSGGQPLSVSSLVPYVVTTPFINTTTTFYISSYNSTVVCESERVPVVVRVNSVPLPPLTTRVSRCGSGSVTFSLVHPVDSAKIRLLDSSTGGNILAVSGGPIYYLSSPVVSQTTTFFTEAYYESTGCFSGRNLAVVEIKSEVGQPTASNVVRCGPGVVTITAKMGLPAGNEIRLYTSEEATTFIASSSVTPYLLTQNIVGTTTYFIEAYNSFTECKSIRMPVIASVKPVPLITSIGNDGPICTGRLLSLSAQASDNALIFWKGPNGFEAIGNNITLMVNSLENEGRYQAWAISEGCTSAPAFTDVDVHLTPPTPIISFTNEPVSTLSICQGNLIPLEISNYSAFPSGTQFRWFGPDTFIVTSGSTFTRNNARPANQGLYTVYAVIEGCTSAFSNTLEVFINPPLPPPALSHNAPLCSGSGRIFLTATVGTEVIDYYWSGPNNFRAQGSLFQSIPALPENAGIYVFRARNRCGWQEVRTNVDILPTPPAPVVVERRRVCEGDTLVLNIKQPEGYLTYWHGPLDWTATIDDAIVVRRVASLEMAGAYSVVNIAGGCTSNSSRVVVDIIPSPPAPEISANSPICRGQDLVLSATLQDNATYHWQGPNGELYESNQNFWKRLNANSTHSGKYWLRTRINGCFSKASPIDVHVLDAPQALQPFSNAPICRGQLLSLTVTPQPSVTYLWQGPAGFSATGSAVSRRLERDNEAGIYTLLAIAGGCTSEPQTIAIRLLPSPALPQVTNNGPVCSGNTASFRIQNYIQNVEYIWAGPAGFAFTSSQPSLSLSDVTIQQAGVYSIVAVGGGCTSAVATSSLAVKLAPPLPLISHNAPICAGQNLLLTAYPDNLQGYIWLTPSGQGIRSVLPNFSLPNVSTQQSGIYQVAAVQAGCTSAFASASIEVMPVSEPPALSSNGPICTQQILELTAISSQPGTIFWNGPNHFTATGATVQRVANTILEGGVYSAFVVSGSCTSRTASINVEVHPVPSAPVISMEGPLCPGGTVTLIARGVPGSSYHWSGPNNFIAEGSTINVPLDGAWRSGNYSVVAILGNCSSEVAVQAIRVEELLFMPIIESNAPVCEGQVLELTAPHISGAEYLWSGPSGFSSTQRDPKINVSRSHSGTFSVIIRTRQCILEPITVDVYVKPTPPAPIASYNGPICENQTLQLSASNIPGATYVWNGPMGFSSTLRNPTILNPTTAHSGNYSVYANLDGCASPVNTLLVHVNPGVSVTTIQHNSPICEGQSIYLTPSSILPGYTYLWRGPNGFVAHTPRVARHNSSVRDAGVYSLVISNGTCSSRVITITVHVDRLSSPPVVSSNSPLCEGETLRLTATSIAGVSYLWSGPLGFSSTLNNPTIPNVTTQHAGNYHLLAILGACTSEAATHQVQVRSIPSRLNITTNAPICEGGALQVQATSVEGVTYRWSGPAGFTSSAAAFIISNVKTINSGTYSLVASAGNCASPVQTIDITIHPRPNAPQLSSSISVCANQSLQLSAIAPAGVSYHWSGPNGFSSTLQSPSISNINFSHAGVYSLVVAYPGCTSEVGVQQVQVKPSPVVNPQLSKVQACSSESIELTTPSQPGVNYRWIGPAGFTATGPRAILASVSVNNQGSYSLEAELGGCTTRAATPVLSVASTPDISSATTNSPLCEGGTLILQTPSILGTHYLWLGPNGYSSSTSLSTISGVSLRNAGIYTLQAIANGCTSARVFSVTVTPQLPAPQVQGATTICQGQALNLSVEAPEDAVIFWSGPLGFVESSRSISIPNISQQQQGNYSVMLLINGCLTATRIIPVTVLPAPTIFAATNSSIICEGASLELTASFILGATYLWTGPNGFVSSLQNPILENVTVEQAGHYAVTAVVRGCTSEMQRVVVNVQKLPELRIVNPGPVCKGSRLILSASSAEGASYLWRGPANFVSNQSFILFNSVEESAVGVYSVMAIQNGCTSAVATTEVQFLDSPAFSSIHSNAPICSGNTLHLSVPYQPNITYQWSGPNNFRASQAAVSIPNISTLYQGRYTVTLSTGSCEVRQHVDVIVLPTPTLNRVFSNSPVCEGRMLQLSAEGSGVTYIWSGPANFSSMGQVAIIASAQTVHSGTYSVVAIQQGCTSAPATISVRVESGVGFVSAGSNSPICSGNTLLLTVTPVLGASYNWSGPNGYSSQSQNVSIPRATMQHSGLYTVVVKVGNCSSEPVTVPVLVNHPPAPPSATSNGPVCVGSTLQLSAEWRSGVQYFWIGPNGFSSSLQAPWVLNAQTNDAGIYTVTAIQNGCTSAPTFVMVEVRNCNRDCMAPSVITVSRISHNTATVQWQAPSGNLNPVCYHLRFGPIEVPQESWETLLVPASSTIVTLPNLMPGVEYGAQIRSNCSQCSPLGGNVSGWSNIVQFTTLMARQVSSSMNWQSSVYPNPNKGKFELNLSTSRAGNAYLQLIDVNGEEVYNESFVVTEGDNIKLMNMEGLAPGVYTLILKHLGESNYIRLIIY